MAMIEADVGQHIASSAKLLVDLGLMDEAKTFRSRCEQAIADARTEAEDDTSNQNAEISDQTVSESPFETASEDDGGFGFGSFDFSVFDGFGNEEYVSENPEMDIVLGLENEIALAYIGRRLNEIEEKREASKLSTFSKLTMMDRISDCCYQRSKSVLFAEPGKPQRLLFERYVRDSDGLATFFEVDSYMQSKPGYSMKDPKIQESKAWPIIEACLKRLGFSPAWGQNPQEPWRRGGRNASEGASSENSRTSSGGRKA